MSYIQLAIRNIKRHKKRSLITILTVCLGFSAVGVINGMLNNIFSRLKEQAVVHEKLGHLTIAKKGFFKEGNINPEVYLWPEEDLKNILHLIEKDPDVINASPRINLFGIASNGNSSSIFISEAIVPKDDKKLQELPIDGRLEKLKTVSLSDQAKDRSGVAIGEELASSLGIKEGGYLTLLSSTKDGIANAIDVDVQEVYNTGNPATNDKFVLMNFDLAQELYDTKGAERIVVTTSTPNDLPLVKSRLVDQLTLAGYAVEAQSWEERSAAYGKVKTMFGVIFRVLTIIIAIIVLLTTLNTMQMVVNERAREIGTMQAIGMLKKNIIKLFCFEGLIMGIIGCCLAIPVLLILAGFFKVANITFIPPVASTAIPVNLILKPTVIISLVVLFSIASISSAYLAIKKIIKQEIIKSLMSIN